MSLKEIVHQWDKDGLLDQAKAEWQDALATQTITREQIAQVFVDQAHVIAVSTSIRQNRYVPLSEFLEILHAYCCNEPALCREQIMVLLEMESKPSEAEALARLQIENSEWANGGLTDTEDIIREVLDERRNVPPEALE